MEVEYLDTLLQENCGVAYTCIYLYMLQAWEMHTSHTTCANVRTYFLKITLSLSWTLAALFHCRFLFLPLLFHVSTLLLRNSCNVVLPHVLLGFLSFPFSCKEGSSMWRTVCLGDYFWQSLLVWKYGVLWTKTEISAVLQDGVHFYIQIHGLNFHPQKFKLVGSNICGSLTSL